MQHPRDLGETDTIFGPVSGDAVMPAHLVGTRAALFHLLKATPLTPPVRDAAAPARVFRRDVLRAPRQPAPIYEAAPPVQAAARPWRDIFLEDTFDFVPLRA
jgi:hypothetical protein